LSATNSNTPPHDLAAEKALLGAIFMDPDELDDAVEVVSGPDFYRSAGQKIFEAMCAVSQRGEPIDHVTVSAELERQGLLASCGGASFIEELSCHVPSASSAKYYGAIVRERAQLRRLREAGHNIARAAQDAEGKVSEILDHAEAQVLAVREQGAKASSAETGHVLMRHAMKAIEANYERGEAVTGVATGITELDAMTAGFQPGELIILAARPSQGKTTAGVCWALHLASLEGQKQRAAFVMSLEQPNAQIGLRLLSSRARVDLHRIRNGQLIESDWAKLAKAAGEVAAASIEVDYGSLLSALEIRARARRSAKRWSKTSTPLGLVVVDYLTLMAENEEADTKSAAVGENAARMKSLGAELGVPVLLLAQLNRDPAKAAGGKMPRRPVLSDLRDSGEIEQHADTVIFVHHEPDKDNPENKRPNVVELIVEKQRNGAVGIIHASHAWEFCLIENLHSSQRHQGAQRDWTEQAPHSAEGA
jgi:replicative DNA helicase